MVILKEFFAILGDLAILCPREGVAYFYEKEILMKPPVTDTQGQKSLNLDIPQLLAKLNRAFADEWIAYYQYWLCAKLVEGPIRPAVAKELEEHAQEEYKHAELLADRIIKLGGLPVLSHEQWSTQAGCGYDATKNAYVRAVLEENIKAEQCAIREYNEILTFIGDADPVTYDMIVKILDDEVEHEVDLKRLLNDLDHHEKKA